MLFFRRWIRKNKYERNQKKKIFIMDSILGKCVYNAQKLLTHIYKWICVQGVCCISYYFFLVLSFFFTLVKIRPLFIRRKKKKQVSLFWLRRSKTSSFKKSLFGTYLSIWKEYQREREKENEKLETTNNTIIEPIQIVTKIL